MRNPKTSRLSLFQPKGALLALVGVVCLMLPASAQHYDLTAASGHHLSIPPVSTRPQLGDFEGMQPATLAARQMARVVGFTARLPVNDLPASETTEVYLGYDPDNLYAVFLCHDSQPRKMRARLPKRDDIFEDDSITIQLDTFHDQHRAYFFGVNAGGVQGDGVWVEGTGWDLSFDAVYTTEVRRSPQGYIALLAVPWRSFRFPNASSQHWGILLNRYIARTTEDSFWPRYSTTVQGRLNQMGELEIPSEITAGRNLQFIPYVSFANSRRIDDRNLPSVFFKDRSAEFRAGLDAKMVLHDKLVFDFTANPDFSQVESDDPQVQVNQRFELFFPEKRHFFIENASYFNTPVNLLFTRRIEKPDAGVRMTGKLGQYGLGVLVSDDRGPGESLSSSDPDSGKRALFSVARVTRDLGKQSYVGAIFVRRQFGAHLNTNYGLDVNWKINPNWRAVLQGIGSETRDGGTTHPGAGIYAGIFREGSHVIGQAEYKSYSAHFAADSGFVPRVDIRNLATALQYKFLKEGGTLVSWGPSFTQTSTWDSAGSPLDFLTNLSLPFNFRKNSSLSPWIEAGSTYLRPQDFSGLPVSTRYPIWDAGIRGASTPSNSISFDASLQFGRAVNFVPAAGQLPALTHSVNGTANVNLRPHRKLTITNGYLFAQLKDPNSSQSIFLDHIFRSRWLLQFNPRWSVRLTAQYNALLPNETLTANLHAKQFNGDALLTYRVNQGTAVYVGYNHDLQNLDPQLQVVNGQILRQNSFLNDGRVFFVKVSYLFHY
jgi:hypothetical protein